MFTVAPKGFDAEVVMKGMNYVKDQIRIINEKGKEATAAEKELIPIWQLVVEFFARGFEFLPVHISKSWARQFNPEDGKIRLPFSSLPGLGDKAADSIAEVMKEGEVLSVEELRQRSKISKTHVDILRRNGVLDGISETSQLSFFM
jgi:DNA polymerase-3 subunit alpha (Gram-positive type)